MNKLGKSFNFSKTVATAILGFLLSIFTTEMLFAVPQGMEVLFGEVLLIPIAMLLLYVLNVFHEAIELWWSWRRFRTPVKMGVLLGFVDDKEKGERCKPIFSNDGAWSNYFKNSSSKSGKSFDVDEIYWSKDFEKYAVLLNPFGEIYLEEDRRNFSTYERIKDFISEGGIFCCTGGFPFYYYWDPILNTPIETTPKTRIADALSYKDIRLFFDSLVSKDFGAIILNFPDSPTPAPTYQVPDDTKFFGDLSEVGGTDKVLEFRSLSEGTRGLIPGLRIRHGKEDKFALAAISYGEGYLIIAGMDVRTNVEFEKLAKAITNFTLEIANRHKPKKDTSSS